MHTNLVLGGHTFIEELGTDPMPTPELAAEIVATCLDHGVTGFDTTYVPERIALGRAMEEVGRRDEATIIVGAFFGEGLSDTTAYRPEHLPVLLEQLRTDRIDVLIVDAVEDQAEQERQEALARSWKDEGVVRELGLWCPPDPDAVTDIYSAVFAPYNVTVSDWQGAAYHARGWTTYATSPFFRGWELERRVEESGAPASEVADHLLRYAAFGPDVDYLITSMRKPEWVRANAASWARGPLPAE